MNIFFQMTNAISSSGLLSIKMIIQLIVLQKSIQRD